VGGVCRELNIKTVTAATVTSAAAASGEKAAPNAAPNAAAQAQSAAPTAAPNAAAVSQQSSNSGISYPSTADSRWDDVCNICDQVGEVVVCEAPACPHVWHQACLAVHWGGSLGVIDSLKTDTKLTCSKLRLQCEQRPPIRRRAQAQPTEPRATPASLLKAALEQSVAHAAALSARQAEREAADAAADAAAAVTGEVSEDSEMEDEKEEKAGQEQQPQQHQKLQQQQQQQ